MVDKTSELYTRVFWSLSNQWQATSTFREFARIGLPVAEAEVARSNIVSIEQMFSSGEMDALVLDKTAFLEWAGGAKGMAAKITANQVVTFRSAIDAASIVLLHSVVDAAVSDLCEIAALHAPDDWERWLSDKRIPLSQMRSRSYNDILSAELVSAIEVLKRESLLKRVDRLFAVCQPPAGLRLIQGFVFDRDRLERLDKLRHDIVHGAGLDSSIGDVDKALNDLFRSGLFAFTLLNWKYDIKLDPMFFLKGSASAGPASSSSLGAV